MANGKIGDFVKLGRFDHKEGVFLLVKAGKVKNVSFRPKSLRRYGQTECLQYIALLTGSFSASSVLT